MLSEVQFASYNCRGFSISKVPCIVNILKTCNVILLQETWLLSSQFNVFDMYFPDCTSYSISSVDNTQLLHGRPYGGCTILMKSCYKVIPIDLQSKRICAVQLYLNNCILYLFNIYMPCDTRNTEDDYIFNSVLSDIEYYCQNNDVHHCMLGGDMNTDLSRHMSHNTHTLIEFCNRNGMHLCKNLGLSNITCTYENYAGHKSIIDHFIVSDGLVGCVRKSCQLDLIDNISDHNPLIIQLQLSATDNYTVVNSSIDWKPKPLWNQTDQLQLDKYVFNLDNCLLNIRIPHTVHCTNVLCDDKDHISDINVFHDDVVKACATATKMSVPHSKDPKTKNNTLPGWDEEMSLLKERSLFWHSIWNLNDRPVIGIVYEIMKSVRRRYHYELRKLKKCRNQKIKAAFGIAIAKNSSRDYWKEARNIRGSKQTLTCTIDGYGSNQDIANHFSVKYNTLYNSVQSNNHLMTCMKQNIDANIPLKCMSSKCDCHIDTLSPHDISTVVKSLRSNKADGVDNISSDCIRNGNITLYYYISLLFNSMFTHGSVPESFLLSTMIPIVKNKMGDISNSDNYRAIALSSLLGKVFDKIIISSQFAMLTTCDLQFGYKAKLSTSMCTAMLIEIVQYYTSNNSRVYILFIDASKAFDRIRHDSLFEILSGRGVCPLVLRVLYVMYTNSKMRVRWKDMYSALFDTSNGVKQGGVLSPIMFNLYIDALYERLKRLKLGCHIGDTFAGALGYADDVALIAPSLESLKQMIVICEKYAEEYSIKFNPNKSKLMCFNSNNSCENISISLCGTRVEVVSSFIYLGNYISMDILDRNINAMINTLYGKTNFIRSDFSMLDSSVIYRLHSTYCMSLYGIELYNYNDSNIAKVYTAWRKIVRLLFNLPRMTHNYIVYNLVDNIVTKLDKRLARFIHSIFNSDNKLVRTIAEHQLFNSGSTIAENRRYLEHKYHIYQLDWHGSVECVITKITSPVLQDENKLAIIDMVKELISIRDNSRFDFLTVEQISVLLCSLCVD